MDFSESAIEIAKRNAAMLGLPASVRFVVGDCTRPVVERGSVDIVLDNHALHCLVEDDDRAGFLVAARAALRDRGMFFTETMSREGGFNPGAFGAVAPNFVNGSRTRRWVSLAEHNAELASAGFAVVSQRLRPQADAPQAGDLIWTVAVPA